MLFPRGFLLSMGSEAGGQGSRNLLKQKFWAWGAVSTCLWSREPMNCWISPTLTLQYVWNVKMIFDVLWTQLNGFNVDLRKSLVSCSLSPSSKSTRGRVDSEPNYRVRYQLIPASVCFFLSQRWHLIVRKTRGKVSATKILNTADTVQLFQASASKKRGPASALLQIVICFCRYAVAKHPNKTV